MTARYRRKPVEYAAFHWTGANEDELRAWLEDYLPDAVVSTLVDAPAVTLHGVTWVLNAPGWLVMDDRRMLTRWPEPAFAEAFELVDA